MTAQQAVDLIRERTEEGAALISSLSDAQLALPTPPPRARGQALADTIELVFIGHYKAHQRDIERKMRDGSDRNRPGEQPVRPLRYSIYVALDGGTA